MQAMLYCRDAICNTIDGIQWVIQCWPMKCNVFYRWWFIDLDKYWDILWNRSVRCKWAVYADRRSYAGNCCSCNLQYNGWFYTGLWNVISCNYDGRRSTDLRWHIGTYYKIAMCDTNRCRRDNLIICRRSWYCRCMITMGDTILAHVKCSAL